VVKESEQQQDDKHSKSVAEVALKTLFRISRAWELSENEERLLLGKPDLSMYRSWRNQDYREVSGEVLEAISLVFGIYKNLRIIFPTERRANEWIKKPNAAFGGSTALSIVLEDPRRVRHYLDSWI